MSVGDILRRGISEDSALCKCGWEEAGREDVKLQERRGGSKRVGTLGK